MKGDGSPLACALRAAAVIGLSAATPLATVTAQPTVFACTNPASGARWAIHVDFAHDTVDSWPADVTSRWITWHDRADQGFYSLNRASGELTITRASSTGGYEQRADCRPD